MEKYLYNYPPVLNVNNVAEILGVTPKTVRNLIKSKTISSIKVGRLVRVTKESLIDYLQGKMVTN